MRDQLEFGLDEVATQDVVRLRTQGSRTTMKIQALLAAALFGVATTSGAQTPAPTPGAAPTTDPIVQRIEARGGFVVRDRDGSIAEVSLARTWATDEDLSYVAQIPTL